MKIIEYLVEHAHVDKVRYTQRQTVLDLLREVAKIGVEERISSIVIEASLLVPGFSPRKFGLHSQLDVNVLQRLSSPDAVRLAVLYSGTNNTTKELWAGDEVTLPSGMKVTAQTLSDLRMIDGLIATAADSQKSEHVNLKLKTLSYREDLADLTSKHTTLMRGSFFGSGGILINSQDSAVFIYLACLALVDSGTQVLHAYDQDHKSISVQVTSAHARELLLDINSQIGKFNDAYWKQRKLIDDRKYDRSFQFT
jgi:hypothetical protein